MSEIIRIQNDDYSRYEELLLRKNDVKKECLHLEQEYTRVFGELIIAVFKKKVECARKKKTIEFCQVSLNRGELPNESELRDFIQKETAALQNHLEQMITDYDHANDFTTITEIDATRIRTIYRKIAKQLHPDINPVVQESEQLQNLWLDVQSAYNRNDLKELRELEVLVTKALSETTGEISILQIPDIKEKILALEEEIRHIMDTDPYQYKFLLIDEKEVAARKDALNEELKKYQEYSQQLDAMLTEMLPEGVIMIWDLN